MCELSQKILESRKGDWEDAGEQKDVIGLMIQSNERENQSKMADEESTNQITVGSCHIFSCSIVNAS